MPQACRIGRGRQAHSDRLIEDAAQNALRPLRPADEAINPNRQTSVQREKRSTPTRQTGARCVKRSAPLAGRVPSGRRTNVNSNRRTGPRTKDRGQLRRFAPCCLRRTNVKLRFSSIPSWAKPVQQGSRTQVSMVGNRGKSQTVQLLLPDRFGPEYALEAIRPKSVDLGHINVTKTSKQVHIAGAAVRRIVAALHFRQRPKVTLRMNSAFFRSLRVSERAVLRQVI